jgi:hypothetical protein
LPKGETTAILSSTIPAADFAESPDEFLLATLSPETPCATKGVLNRIDQSSEPLIVRGASLGCCPAASGCAACADENARAGETFDHPAAHPLESENRLSGL